MAMTIIEWCAKHRVTRQGFYHLQKQGKAPKTYRVGQRVRIDDADDKAWIEAQREKSQPTASSAT